VAEDVGKVPSGDVGGTSSEAGGGESFLRGTGRSRSVQEKPGTRRKKTLIGSGRKIGGKFDKKHSTYGYQRPG